MRIETLVLDSEGLSGWLTNNRRILSLIADAEEQDILLAISANTIIEAVHQRTNVPRLQWALSCVTVEPVTRKIALEATKLLKQAGLHGHRHAIDATVAATALAQPGPVAVLTSDPGNISALCGPRVAVIEV